MYTVTRNGTQIGARFTGRSIARRMLASTLVHPDTPPDSPAWEMARRAMVDAADHTDHVMVVDRLVDHVTGEIQVAVVWRIKGDGEPCPRCGHRSTAQYGGCRHDDLPEVPE